MTANTRIAGIFLRGMKYQLASAVEIAAAPMPLARPPSQELTNTAG
ncbi:MAG TPA: hypothetical protein VMJ10_08535 [Kofleriaceae bacterium]|nr:hypothetical protein [Kofleriaceae bacterium]